MTLLNRIALPLLAVVTISPSVVAQPSPPQPAPAPPVTSILPVQVGGVLLINTTKNNWGSFNRFNPFPMEITGPTFLPFLPSGINVQTDVQPWIGEWAAVALMIPKPTTNQESFNLWDSALMVAPVKDKEGMNNFIAKVKEIEVDTPIERDYKGVKIIEWLPKKLPAIEETPTPEIPNEETPIPKTPSDKTQASHHRAPLTPHSASANQRKFLAKSLTALRTHFLASEQAQQGEIEPAPASVPTLKKDDDPTVQEDIPEEPPFVETKPGYAIAVLPGYIATANSSQALEQLVDSQTGIQPLSSAAKFQRLLKNSKFSQGLLVGYSNLEDARKLLPAPASSPENSQEKKYQGTTEESTPEEFAFPDIYSPVQFFSKVLETLANNYDTIDVVTWVQDEGVRSQSSIYYKTPKPENATQNTPDADRILSKLPAASYMFGSSRNFKQQWDYVVKQSGEEGKPFFDKMRENISTSTGLDLEKDILSWMDGEYAVVFFPSDKSLFSMFAEPFKLGMAIMIQTSNRPAAEKMLSKLEEYIKTSSKGFITIANRPVGNQSVTSWEINQPEKGNQSVLAHHWTDDNTLIVSSGVAPMSRLTPQPKPPLSSTYIFQTATSSFPRPNDGYFFLNWGASLSFVYSFLPPETANSEFAVMAKEALGRIRSLSWSNHTTAEKEQSDFLMVIAPANKDSSKNSNPEPTEK